MREVQRILVLMLLLGLAPACGSSQPADFETKESMQGPEVNPVDDTDRDAPLPKGFVADSAAVRLHRADCPQVKKCDPADRVFFVTPWPALNEGYEPCDYCEPLKGWR